MGEFVYNGNKYPESTVEKYFRKGSSGTMSQEREDKVIFVWKYRKEKKKKSG